MLRNYVQRPSTPKIVKAFKFTGSINSFNLLDDFGVEYTNEGRKCMMPMYVFETLKD